MYAATATHATLLLRLSAGQDAGAWSEFLERYGGLIRGYCLRRGLQAADADDIQQDVLVSLGRAMPGFRYDPSRGRFRSYLRTIVANAIATRFCQNRPGPSLSSVGEPVQGDHGDQDEPWEHEWRQYHLRLAMRTIEIEFSEADRTAFDLYAVQGRDARETAQELGMSVESVYQAKSRIMRRLSAIIAGQVEEEG